MINVRNSRYRRTRSVDINMAPLIDMVFLLLIFFLVTTSFVKETGVEVQRPAARTAEPKEQVSMLIGVTREGLIVIEDHPVDVRSVRSQVERYLAETPEGAVIIVADKESQTGIVIRIFDECRLAGVENVSIAAKRENP